MKKCFNLNSTFYSSLFSCRTAFLCSGRNVSKNSYEDTAISDLFRKAMRKVPQPVVVVTASVKHASQSSLLKRGVTCSSFVSISAQPPIVSFAITQNSRMHNLLLTTNQFAIHLLSKTQVGYAVHFSRPVIDGEDQFENVEHSQTVEGPPLLPDANAILICQRHLTSPVGDHHVWYGEVQRIIINSQTSEPMLYYKRSFRSVGDETFLQAFEERTLPFEEWTHEAHLRMAWNYIRELGIEDATSFIKNGIKKFNELNKDKLSRGYHETVTMFYIQIVHQAIERTPSIKSFEDFLSAHPYILDKNLIFNFYSLNAINDPKAKYEFLPPDLKSLHSTA